MSSSLEREGRSPRWGTAISAQRSDYQALHRLNNDATRALLRPLLDALRKPKLDDQSKQATKQRKRSSEIFEL